MQLNSEIRYFLVLFALFVFLLPSCIQQKDQVDDWLIDGKSRKAEIKITDNNEIQISNGLIQRTFYLGPNLACFDFTNLMSDAQLLRAIMPEARITLGGKDYNIGGLHGQKERAYFKKEWLDKMKASDEDFQYESMVVSEIASHFPTKTNFWTSHKENASGKKLSFL